MKKKGNEREYMRNYMRDARSNKVYASVDSKYNNKLVRVRHELKAKAIVYLGGACSRCGQSFDAVCMDFHHKDYTQKDFNIATLLTNKSWNQVKAELNKCVLVCSNCHRIIHKETKYDCYKNKPESNSNQFNLF